MCDRLISDHASRILCRVCSCSFILFNECIVKQHPKQINRKSNGYLCKYFCNARRREIIVRLTKRNETKRNEKTKKKEKKRKESKNKDKEKKRQR